MTPRLNLEPGGIVAGGQQPECPGVALRGGAAENSVDLIAEVAPGIPEAEGFALAGLSVGGDWPGAFSMD